jgi:UrcA family protein
MFAHQTRSALKALAFAALVLSTAIATPLEASASTTPTAHRPADFTFAYDKADLLEATARLKLDQRLRRDVRRYCSANAMNGLSVVAETACRRAVLREARLALAARAAEARASAVLTG